jgi:plasmid stabilization system protein ParE
MARLLVREKAWSDLAELGAFIARDNPAAAAEVVCQLRVSFEQLGRMPQLGRVVRKIKTTEELRMDFGELVNARVFGRPDLVSFQRSRRWCTPRCRLTSRRLPGRLG